MNAFPTPKHLACGPTCGSTGTFGTWPNHRRALLARFSRPRSGPGALPRHPILGHVSTAPNSQRSGVPQRGHKGSVSRAWARCQRWDTHSDGLGALLSNHLTVVWKTRPSRQHAAMNRIKATCSALAVAAALVIPATASSHVQPQSFAQATAASSCGDLNQNTGTGTRRARRRSSASAAHMGTTCAGWGRSRGILGGQRLEIRPRTGACPSNRSCSPHSLPVLCW
jgi:hypothetical protein